MKTLKVICTATVLALVLAVPAYAGDISTPGLKACVTPPSPTQVSDEKDSPEDVTPTNSCRLDSADFFQFVLALMY